MSELIKLEKSDEMLIEIKRKANHMFTLEDAIWSHECIAIMQLIDEELERRNTRTASPRFTAEERDALKDGLLSMKIMLLSEKIKRRKLGKSRIAEYEKNIAIVQTILEGSV